MPLLYVAFTVYVPARRLWLAVNCSPLPATKVGLKFEVWSVFVASTTVHVVPSVGFEISVVLFARAWKKTAGPPLVTLWLGGLTVTDVTPWIATVTVVEPEQAEQLPALPVIVAEPGATPVTNPDVCPTETAAESLEDHVTPEVMVF